MLINILHRTSSLPLANISRLLRRCMNNQTAISSNVSGLSEKVLSHPQGEVGPGASKTGKYKNPEYFSYNKISYFEAEIELHKYRLPQPSSKTK